MNSTIWSPLVEPLNVSGHVVHVIRVNLQADLSRVDNLRSLLSTDELARADRYKIDRPRRHFIVCRASLRTLLGSCIRCPPEAVEFQYGPHGKPALKRNHDGQLPLEFSVSHSADQALIAVAFGRRTGVDVEQIDDSVRILKLAERFFSSTEAAELNQLPKADQLAGFFRGWTCKEAYLKATGFGLSFPLNKFSVSLNPHEPPRLKDIVDQPDELSRWRLMTPDSLPGYAAAVLFEARSEETVNLYGWTMPEI